MPRLAHLMAVDAIAFLLCFWHPLIQSLVLALPLAVQLALLRPL